MSLYQNPDSFSLGQLVEVLQKIIEEGGPDAPIYLVEHGVEARIGSLGIFSVEANPFGVHLHSDLEPKKPFIQ